MPEQPIPSQHLATLYEITRQLNSSLDLRQVLNYIMDQVIAVTQAERGFLMLRDEETSQLTFEVARGIDRTDLEKPKFQVSLTVINQVAETGQSLLTDNAQNHFGEAQSVVAMALRSILCVPIKVKGRVIGIIYMDNRIFTDVFDESELDLMNAFALQAGIAIENARLYQIAVEKGRMQRDLEMGQQIQSNLLPTRLPVLPGYEVAYYWNSAWEVAGDFYDCFSLDHGAAMGVVVADVSGKGVAAALFMAVARSLLRGNASASLSPEETLRQANRLIMEDAGSSGMFVTVYYSRFERQGRMVGVNGGHNQPLLWRASNQTTEWLPKGGRALGWFDDLPVQPQHYQLQVGDVVVFYTDGLTEAECLTQEQFGESRLEAALKESAGQCDAEGVKDHILAVMADFMGEAPPFDDCTLVVVRYIG
jgi:sigma-B regulation protein RsbU (phosphoserine phosphatase)